MKVDARTAFAICTGLMTLTVAAAPAAPPKAAVTEDQALPLIGYTLAYRLEQARQLESSGDLAAAAKIYDELIEFYDAVDGLTAEAWLRAADLKARRDEVPRAIALWREVTERFAAIPWAVDEAQQKLALYSKADSTAPAAIATSKAAPSIAGRRRISLEVKEAKLENITAIFQSVLGVPLDVDPALAGHSVELSLKNVPADDALQIVAQQIGARVEPLAAGGYRLVATPSATASAAPQPKPLSLVGELSTEEIRQVMRANLDSVRRCYEPELLKRPDLAGKVVVEFTIGADGAVTTTRIASDTMQLPVVGECLRAAISSWRFPKPRNGGEVQVAYPFVFSSPSSHF